MNVLSNRRFLFTWLSGVFVTLGFSIFFLSVSWLTIDVLEQPGLLGMIMTAVSLPRVLMMVFGGVFADRYQKSRLLFLTNIVQALLMAVMVLLHVTESYSVTALLVIAVSFGILDGISYPALSSLLPTLVKKKELHRANSLFQGSLELMFVIGPFLAGLLLTLGGYSLSFGTSSALIFLSAALILPKWIGDSVPDAKKLAMRFVIDDLKEGISYVFKTPVLRSGTLAIASVNLFVMGPVIMSIPILVGERGGTPFDLSLIEGGLAVGTFAASFLMLMLRSVHRGRFVYRALFLTAIAFFFYTQAQSISLLALTAGLSGFMLMLVYLPAVTVMQEHSDQDKLGRVMSIMALAASGLEPVAFSVLSVLVALSVPIQTLLLVFAGLMLAAGIFLYIKGGTLRKTP
ncbi:MFS transporter [Metabacillus sp. JX24]|uniref:MFS transporter n=1 Tax=Metabacillus sp. JX24 TaxID=3240759 RepID=UPI00350FB75F